MLGRRVHHGPGTWVGHAVLSNTFRHPVVLAMAAVVLDHATGGRFALGLGAGWHEPEHRAFGLDLPPIKERIDRLESAVDVLHALWSPEAAQVPGVTRPDPFYPLDAAVNLPAPMTAGGPPIFLGGQKRRGIALAGRAADGWLMPGDRAGDVEYLAGKREELSRALEAQGRSPDALIVAGQVVCGESEADRRRALDQARAMQLAGATHLVLGMAPRLGPDGLRAIAREVAEPLLETEGWVGRAA